MDAPMIALALFLAFIPAYVLVIAATRLSWRHRRNVRTAWRVHDRLHEIALQRPEDDPSWLLSYLRKTDPFVFEELVLISLRGRGYRIRRNRRYSGDGGVDGRASKSGILYLVQCKRYSGYIQKADVEALEELCRRKGCRGLFVHTGKTGKGSLEAASERVSIISGSLLYELLINDKGNKS